MLATVNIIEMCNGSIMGLTSFPDNAKGNGMAEDLFVKFAKENGAPSDEIQESLNDGLWDSNGYAVCIVHSNGGEVPNI